MLLRNRLLAATAALALASAQVSPGFALVSSQFPQQNTSPVPNPDGLTPQQLLRLPPADLGAGTTVGGDIAAGQSFVATAIANLKTYFGSLLQQNYTLQVPSAAALRTTVVFTGVVAHRGGFGAPGDGGEADYAGAASACPAPLGDDGGTCENAPGGSWRIDLGSIRHAVTPFLFENVNGVSDDTAAFKACFATGLHCDIPPIPASAGHSWTLSSDVPQTTSGQLITGHGRVQSKIVVNSNAGFSQGVFVSTAAEPGPIFRDFSITFAQPNSSPVHYVPAIYAQNVPRWRSEHMGYYACWICIDMRGNDGGTTFEDTQMSDFEYGRWIDGSLDTIRIKDDHVFPFGIPSQLYNNYILSFGLSGSYNQVHNFVGRADDLKISGGIYLAGMAFDVHKSTYNPNDSVGATIVMEGTRFDVSPGLICSGYANVTVAGAFGGSGGPGLTGFVNNGCNLSITGSYLQMSSTGTGTTSAPSGSAVFTYAGVTVIANNIFDIGSADATVVGANTASGQSLPAGHTTLTGNVFNRNANISYPNSPVINLLAGDVTAMGNSINAIGSGSGRFFYSVDASTNRVIGNSSPGYPAYQPSSPAGIYGMNY